RQVLDRDALPHRCELAHRQAACAKRGHRQAQGHVARTETVASDIPHACVSPNGPDRILARGMRTSKAKQRWVRRYQPTTRTDTDSGGAGQSVAAMRPTSAISALAASPSSADSA